jgi:HPt (histidine-containing phosphotransfer) domain-containing protein
LRVPIPALFDRQQIGVILDSFAAERSAQLLAGLEASIQDSLGSIRKFLADGQFAHVSRRAHRLAGAALSFGLPALHRSAHKLEASIELEDRALLEQWLADTEKAADAALQAIVLLRRDLSGDAMSRVADGQIAASH